MEEPKNLNNALTGRYGAGKSSVLDKFEEPRKSTAMGARGVERALQAFQNPMLDLLHRTYAPFVVTVLAMVFTPERPRVAVADAHAEIDDALDQLRAAGYGDEDNQPLPAGNARDLCRQWVQAGWLGAAGVRRGRRGVPAVRARRRPVIRPAPSVRGCRSKAGRWMCTTAT